MKKTQKKLMSTTVAALLNLWSENGIVTIKYNEKQVTICYTVNRNVAKKLGMDVFVFTGETLGEAADKMQKATQTAFREETIPEFTCQECLNELVAA